MTVLGIVCINNTDVNARNQLLGVKRCLQNRYGRKKLIHAAYKSLFGHCLPLVLKCSTHTHNVILYCPVAFPKLSVISDHDWDCASLTERTNHLPVPKINL